jgi:hypothetical protein
MTNASETGGTLAALALDPIAGESTKLAIKP